MAQKRPRYPSKGCLIIAPIADESTPERKKIHRRAKYLEKQIAAALKPLGYEATLITSDKRKEWITPHMIQRLTTDPLTVAVLDGANPNCMYEVGIRHASCLPMICLIEEKAEGPHLPFNIQDVDPVQYPRLGPRGTWTARQAAAFRRSLTERAAKAPSDKPSASFAAARDRSNASGFRRLIFTQKLTEMDSLRRDLEEYRDVLRGDYEIKQFITKDAATRLFKLLRSSNHRLSNRNQVLEDLMKRQELSALEDAGSHCLAVCSKISAQAKLLSDIARDLKNAAHPKSPARLPTRGTVDSRLRSILRQLAALRAEIDTLLSRPRF